MSRKRWLWLVVGLIVGVSTAEAADWMVNPDGSGSYGHTRYPAGYFPKSGTVGSVASTGGSWAGNAQSAVYSTSRALVHQPTSLPASIAKPIIYAEDIFVPRAAAAGAVRALARFSPYVVVGLAVYDAIKGQGVEYDRPGAPGQWTTKQTNEVASVSGFRSGTSSCPQGSQGCTPVAAGIKCADTSCKIAVHATMVTVGAQCYSDGATWKSIYSGSNGGSTNSECSKGTTSHGNSYTGWIATTVCPDNTSPDAQGKCYAVTYPAATDAQIETGVVGSTNTQLAEAMSAVTSNEIPIEWTGAETAVATLDVVQVETGREVRKEIVYDAAGAPIYRTTTTVATSDVTGHSGSTLTSEQVTTQSTDTVTVEDTSERPADWDGPEPEPTPDPDPDPDPTPDPDPDPTPDPDPDPDPTPDPDPDPTPDPDPDPPPDPDPDPPPDPDPDPPPDTDPPPDSSDPCANGGCDFQDSPFPDYPVLYTQKYPNGLKGVWGEKWPQIQATDFVQSIYSMFPTFGGSGSCPVWDIDANLGGVMNYGTHELLVPCYLWQIIGLIVVTSACFAAWRIIF